MSLVRKLRFFALALVIAFVAAACQVDVEVVIDVDEDGGGQVFVEVTLDQEAASRVVDINGELRVADLAEAGWEFSPAIDVEGGATRIRANKKFTDPDQLQGVLDELTGPGGMFRDFEIVRETAFAEQTFALNGFVDLRDGLDLFNDERVTELLGGEQLGRPLDELLDTEDGQEALDDAVLVRVKANLPGEGPESEGVWLPRFDGAGPTVVTLEAVDEQFVARLLRWVGLAAGVLFLLSVVLGVLGWMFEKRARGQARKNRTPQPMAERVPGVGPPASTAGAATVAPAAAAKGPHQLRLVVLDARGVLYGVGRTPGDLLLPFIREQGGDTPADEILDRHLDATLGRISTGDFWEACGIEGDPDELDDAYLDLLNPRIGAPEFIREMQRREMPVTCLTNDVSIWSRKLRERDNLSMIWPWVISGDVGVRKPDPGMFEALRRETGVPYENCLFIDNNADNLDTAKTLGMATAYFADERPSARIGHPIVTNFGDFFRRR